MYNKANANPGDVSSAWNDFSIYWRQYGGPQLQKLLLTAMDLHPDGVDVQAVIDQLWARLSPSYRTTDLTAQQLDGWRLCLARDVWRTVELLAGTGLVTMDLTLDREQRQAARVPVTVLGRWVLRQTRGGPGACPPEDCGGIPGYQHLRTILAGPPAAEQQELLEWLGLTSAADLDPTRFDPHDADARLAALARITG